MAYAAPVSLAQTIDLILHYHQHSIPPQVRDQIISIHKYAIFLQAFLEDFPDKTDSLQERIMEATHVAEDAIEFFMSELIHESSVGQSKSKLQDQPKGKFDAYLLDELKRVTNEIESIAEKVKEITDSVAVKDARLGDSSSVSSSSRLAPMHKDAIVGFDNDLMEIKSRLCRQSSKLEIVPIFGMGGIGKTTLARNVYDDPLIVEYFQIRAWVTVSQDYSVQEIVLSLLVSMKVYAAKSKSMGAHHVYQNLKGRRYLIVLDDMWSITAWDDLKTMFPDDGNGSRIMLTTRLLDVANYPDSCSRVHEMHLMDEDQSWNLLRQKLFKQDPCPVELENVGKMIARRCRGLPLAIVVISGLLSTVDRDKTVWKNIARNVKSAISANDEQFDNILSLSYTHLPHRLRPCFLYMGGFPEDYEMYVSKLIKLWVAEGFLKRNGLNKTIEETGEEYLGELVNRSLVLVTKRKSNGRIKSFSMHDLMREMCMRKAEEENFFLHVRGSLREGIKISRRVSISLSHPYFFQNALGSTIRTIICLEHRKVGTGGFLGYFRLLRVLDVADTFTFFMETEKLFPSLPDEVFELFYLRYLAFDYHLKIPAAISNLRNLQTLVICSGKEWRHFAHKPIFVSLPREIWRMMQLRHLILHFHLLPFQEGAEFALENLQTLSEARNFVCSEKILEMIPNLKKLGVSYTVDDEEKYDEDYQLHNLTRLQQLENLKIKIYNDFPHPDKVNPAFPRTLRKLVLSGLGLPWKDLTVVGSLPNLEVLKLRDYACSGDKWETAEGEFSLLNFLLIEESDLKHWISESTHFPTLKFLVLSRCPYLREIPDGIGEIPTLELIEVDDRNKCLVDSAKRIQDEQQSSGDYALKVHFVKDFLTNDE